jgi:DNA-binding response OmpR family regulator
MREREPMRLLVVEDDDSIGDPLTAGLGREGFSVVRARTAREALAADPVDLVLLDLGLPDVDGREVCRRLRELGDTPIIVVTARSDEIDRVLLLEIGADDYVVKPFGFRELVARIRAVARRTSRREAESSTSFAVGPLQVDQRRHEVRLGGQLIDLTPKEFDVLALLAAEPGSVFSRQEILERLWDAHWYGPTKTLDVHVASLRKKLSDPRWIRTVRGVGFALEDPTAEPGAGPA